MNKIFAILLVSACLLSLHSLVQTAYAQQCFGPNNNPIPCPEQEKKKKKTATSVPPTRTLTPTASETATLTLTPTETHTQTSTSIPSATGTPTITPLFGLQSFGSGIPLRTGAACFAWPLGIYSGLGFALMGILLHLMHRSDTGSGYISSHELGHAKLNSTDEYVESGFNRGLRIVKSGLFLTGGLLATTGIAGSTGILPCASWSILAGLDLGIGILVPFIILNRIWTGVPSVPDMDADSSGMAEETIGLAPEEEEEK